jgi:type I restriction-modification system DNA methylase subunit
MGDLAVERYKNYVKAATDNWKKKADAPGKKLLELDGKITALQAKKPISAADQAQLDKYEVEYTANRAKIEKANKELELELAVYPVKLEKTKQNAAEIDMLPKEIKAIIKAKGIPIGKNVVIAPDNVNFDFKAMKLKSLGFKITWRF